MDDFLYILKLKLSESLPEGEVSRQVLAYEDYINERLAAGDLREDIEKELGDPAEVARLVAEKYAKQAEKDTKDDINAAIQNPKHGIKAKYIEGEGWDVRLGKLKLNSWLGTLIILFLVFGVVALVQLLLRQSGF